MIGDKKRTTTSAAQLCCPSGGRRARAKLGGIRFRRLGFSRKTGTHVLAVASSTSDWRPSVLHQHRRMGGKS